MRNTWLLSFTTAAVLIAAPAAMAQTATGYAIQMGQTVGSGARPPAVAPPSFSGDNNPRTIAIPSSGPATVKAYHSHHEKVVDDSDSSDDDQSSPTDNWVEVK